MRRRLAAVTVLLLAAAAARADGEDDIARCARLASTADRILCLENALRRADDAPRPASQPATQPAPAPAEPAVEHAAGSEAPPADAREEQAARAAAGFGLEEAREAEPEAVRVTVVAIGEDLYGRHRYTTESGQRWQQIDQRTPRYDDPPFAAEIRGAAAGSYFLQPIDGGIAVRVRRER